MNSILILRNVCPNHGGSSLSSFITIGGIVFLNYNPLLSFAKFFSIIGLYIDIIGVLIASLKTPYLGAFLDGGELEHK